MMEGIHSHQKGIVCVTGGAGYVGSWLVKTLLENGYAVHATVRDPDNRDKYSSLLTLPGANERLRIFKADLTDEGSFDAAVSGCQGVFHVATPVDIHSPDPQNFIQRTISGTMNVLNSCARVKSVRRVVYTSSIATATSTTEESYDINESSWTFVDLDGSNKSLLRIYAVAKTLAEKAALHFGKENSMEVVSIVPSIVAGPSITSTVPLSVQETMSLITGNRQMYGVLKSSESILNATALVHIEDLCNACLFLMEHPFVEERYICSAHCTTVSELANFISQRYPRYNAPTKFENVLYATSPRTNVSSKKLLDLGFNYKHGLDDIVDDSIQYFQKLGILD